MPDYIITFRRKGKSDEEAQVRASIPAVLSCIEEWNDYDCEPDYVLAVELIEGRRVSRDVTDEINQQLEAIAAEREAEAAKAYADSPLVAAE